MAVTFRTTTQLFGTGTSPTATEPAGTVQGDVLFAIAEVDTVNVAAPAGWLPLGSVTSGTTRYRADYIIRGASAPDLTWVHTGSVFREIDIVCCQTSGGPIRLDSQSAVGGTGTSLHQPDASAAVAIAASSLALTCGGCGAVGASTSPPAGYTMRTTTPADLVIASKALSASGSEDPGAFAGFLSGDWWDGVAATFTDVAAGPVLSPNAPAVIKKLVPIQQRMP